MSDMSKINVLEVTLAINYSTRVVLNWSQFMNRQFFVPYVATYGGVGGREDDLKRAGIEYIITNGDVPAILAAIKKWQIDVLHIHRSGHFVQLEYEILVGAKKINPNLIIIETNVFGKFDEQSYPLIDCSLQISKMMLNERYLKKVGKFDYDRTKILYNPIDWKGFDSMIISAEELSEYKKKIGINPGDFVIGKLGRPHIAKWSDLLLDMMPYLVRLVPNVKFIVQAMPESRKKIVLASKWKNNFVLLDQTSDDRQIALFYRAIDVYVHASKIGESFGMTLAEAGVFGKPVVVNSTPRRDNNQLELIEHMQTGIIANHPQTFARALAFLYHHPDKRRQFGMAARSKVISTYDAEYNARQLEKVFVEKLLQKSILIDQTLIQFYQKIRMFPSPEEIIAYRKEYRYRLRLDYGQLTAVEILINLLMKPKKFYFKVRDFLEHRFGI